MPILILHHTLQHPTALVKQVNPHWKAFFFVTDEKPFEEELQSILHKYNDNRLTFLNVPVAHRPAVSALMRVDLMCANSVIYITSCDKLHNCV